MMFNEIRAFRAVMRTGSMTKAAMSMHMSQPNISRLITRLEEKTRLALFSRSPGKLIPTEEAHALFQEVERLFVGLESLELSIDSIRKFGNGRLRIASVPSLSFSLLPKAICRFNKSIPDVPISVHTDTSSMVVQWVASGFCDFGMVSYIDEAAMHTLATDISIASTSELEAICILPEEHPLQHERVITPNLLAGSNFISMAPSDPLRMLVDHAFQPSDHRNLIYDTPYAVTICQMVSMGLGVSIVNPLVTGAHSYSGVLVKQFRPRITFSSHVVVPKYRAENSLMGRFLYDVQATLSEELINIQAMISA